MLANHLYFPNVLINHCCNFLAFGEIFAFRLSCTEINRKISPTFKNFNNFIKARLTECFKDTKDGTVVNVDEFLTLIHNSHCIISGSFILQCITGENWDSDIDIFYVKLKPEIYSDLKFGYNEPKPIMHEAYIVNREFNKEVYEKGKLADNFINYMSENFTNTNIPYDDYNFELSALCLSYSYATKNVYKKPIDIIGIFHQSSIMNRNEEYLEMLNLNNLMDKKIYNSASCYIKEETDMEFLKCVYDGKQLKVKDWNSIWNRQCEYFIKDLKIIPFYYYVDEKDEIYVRQSYILRMYSRIHKYRKRGFNIVSDIDEVILEKESVTYIKNRINNNHNFLEDSIEDIKLKLNIIMNCNMVYPPNVMIIKK